MKKEQKLDDTALWFDVDYELECNNTLRSKYNKKPLFDEKDPKKEYIPDPLDIMYSFFSIIRLCYYYSTLEFLTKGSEVELDTTTE